MRGTDMQHIQPSGGDDSQAIQAMLDRGETVSLSGMYRIARPLRMVKSARIIGSSLASILWVGPTIDAPAIEVQGRLSHIANVYLWCQKRCRGIRYVSDYYCCIADRLWIEDANGIALELIDCCNGNMNEVRLIRTNGVALRAVRCNSVHYDCLQIAHCDITKHGPVLHVPEAENACVSLVDCDLTKITNVLFEPVTCGQYPSIYIRGNTVTVDTARWEGGSLGRCHAVVEGDGWWMGTHNTFRAVSITSKEKAEVFCELRGKTRDIVVSQLMASTSLTKGIVRCVGATHKRIEVAHCFAENVPDIINA